MNLWQEKIGRTKGWVGLENKNGKEYRLAYGGQIRCGAATEGGGE